VHPVAPRRRWLVILIAVLAIILAGLAVNNAVRWYDHPFAEVLVDPDGVVSGVGAPSWEGMKQGLRFPDRILSVDGEPLARGTGSYPARVFDRAIDRAAAAGRPSVRVEVATSLGLRAITLPIRRFGAASWWLIGGVLFIAAALYVVAALTALYASPDGPLARTFAKTALAAALFILTLLDVQTTRALVPLWRCAFAMVPVSFVALALRLPDDVPLVRRFPLVIAALDAVGFGLAASTVLLAALDQPTTPIQSICSVMFVASQLFLVATFFIRFARATGARRGVMRVIFASLVPVHTLVAVGVTLAMLSTRESTATFFVTLPVLSITPLSAVVAFVRHDLWGSRALLSRVITLAVVAAIASLVALALGAAFVASLGVPFRAALVAAAAGAVSAAFLVPLALRLTDRGFFPSRAEYKPTIEQLSEELTAITDRSEVARSVERTVRRWLDCQHVAFVESAGEDDARDDGPSAHFLSLPVTFRGESLGLIHVGQKRGGALFTSDDLDLLRTIANQAALALAHAHSYRELEERRRQQAAAWRGERLALIETLAAEIAHEVRYPINYFRSVFQRGTREGQLDAEEIEIGCEEVDRLERLVSGLKRVASHRLERRVVPLAELAARAEVLLRDALAGRRFEVSVPESVVLRCDADQATQIVVNLVSNALDAAGVAGAVGIQWREAGEASSPRDASDPAGTGGELVVWDTGPGFDGDAAQLFAPWFTTKPRGTGLGLAITQRIVRAHGWSIDARRVDGRTQFVIAITAADRADLASRPDIAASSSEPRLPGAGAGVRAADPAA
jgi:two-component system sensor histidine kinase HydH